MAQNFTETKTIQGDGDPGDGDALCTNLATFPIGTIYINSLTGKTFVRNTITDDGVAADWVSQEGGGGDNFANADLTLDGNRTHDLDGNTLAIQQGGVDFLSIDPTAGSEQAALGVVNTTGDGNFSGVEFGAQNTETSFLLSSVFNNGAKTVQIESFADATIARLTHTADEHVFVGAVILPTSDPGVEGALWNNAGTPAISAG